MFMKGITKKFFFDFGSILTEISQKSFLGICHVPGLSAFGRYGPNLFGAGSK
jgi:hypothetical protein